MSDFTIANLKEIDNAGAKFGIEARFGRSHLDSEHLGASYFSYPAGFHSSLGHSHREQEEIYVVVSGSGRIKLNDEIRDVRQWDAVRIAPQTVRAVEAGPDGLVIIAVGADRPEGGDGVQVKDWWTD